MPVQPPSNRDKAHKLVEENARLESVLKRAWLLGDKEIESIQPGDANRLSALLDSPSARPLGDRTDFDIENPAHHILRLMRNPDYFPFTCEKVFNITLLPLQHVILKELWYKPFPMLVGSRGLGKSFILALHLMLKCLIQQGTKAVIVGAAFRQAKVVFEYVEMIWANAPVLRDLCGSGRGRNNREQGPRRDIDRCECIIGDSIIIALPLGDGKKIRGQRANIIAADEFACLSGDTLVETDLGLMRIEESGKEMGSFQLNTGNDGFESPADFIITPPTDAYRVTTEGGYSFVCSNIHQSMTTDGWKLGKDLTTKDYLPLPSTYKFPSLCISRGSLTVDESLAWLMGILTAEGSINNRHVIYLKSTDEGCVNRVRGLLAALLPERHIKIRENEAYYDDRGWDCKAAFSTSCCHVRLREELVTLGLECQVAAGKKIPWSILRSPRNIVLSYLSGLFDGDGSAFLWTDRGVIGHLGIAYYSVSEQLCREVQALLMKLGLFSTIQSRKSKISKNLQWIVRLNGADAHKLGKLLIVPRWEGILALARPPYDRTASGVVWDKSRKKWKAEVRVNRRPKYLGRFVTAEEARACVEANRPARTLRVRSVKKLPEKQVLYDFYLPRTHCFVGGGFGQHNSIPPDIYETVVAGFAAVSADPVGNVKEQARIRVLKKLGLWNPAMEAGVEMRGSGNQAILSGTANYSFNWFCKYWLKYKAIIESRGDHNKLAALSSDNTVDPTLNWRDYSVIRIPVDMLPYGFMDQKHVARSKLTQNSGTYLMEFGACQLPGSKLITPSGPVIIEEAKPGMLVLTHRGRFRPILRVMTRDVSEDVIQYKTLGYNKLIGVTKEHPYWRGGENWLPIKDIENNTCLANLCELSGCKHLDVRARVKNYSVSHDGKLYPRASQSRFNNEEVSAIRAYAGSASVIARHYNTSPGAIFAIRNCKKTPKNAIPATIALDFDFGLVIGYYAAEGSKGAHGRNVGFALDGHVNVSLEFFVAQLSESLYRVFGFKPKHYTKDEVTSVCPNSRLVADLITSICPGLSATKRIDADVLFSNEEFLRGFIVGYWNGDGHRSQDRTECIAGCINEGLLVQLRLALSYFGISSTLASFWRSEGRIRDYITPAGMTYTLVMNGDNARRFHSLFYGVEKPCGRVSRITNDGIKSVLPLVERREVAYSGPVYNLEVEEDNSYSLLNATVHNCFANDSEGFFKRSLIESCVAGNPENNFGWTFNASLKGQKGVWHIIAVDPASEKDNFAIVVIAIHEDHRRVVHCWTTRKKDFQKRQAAGLTTDQDFYGFCARKIRELMSRFPCVRLVMDGQGGGVAVEEALHDSDKLKDGEVPIWQVIDPDPKQHKDSDGKKGLHILEIVQFARAEWTAQANHGMKKDMEDKVLLFPYMDAPLLGLSVEDDKQANRIYDTLEDATMEIEQLKDELATIVVLPTPSGRERWDTPTVKGVGSQIGRLRKDRYSALVMANMAARQLAHAPVPLTSQAAGGWAGDIARQHHVRDEQMYILGEGWSEVPDNNVFGQAITRKW